MLLTSQTRQQAVSVPPHEVPQGRAAVGLPARGLHKILRAQAEPDGPREAAQEGQQPTAVQVQHVPAHLRRLHRHGRAPRPEAPRSGQRHLSGRLRPIAGRFRSRRCSDWPAGAGGRAADYPHGRGVEGRGKFHAALRAGRRGKHPSRNSQRLALKVVSQRVWLFYFKFFANEVFYKNYFLIQVHFL